MIETISMLQVGTGGATLAVTALVLYRITALEKDVQKVEDNQAKANIDIAIIKAKMEKEE